MLMLGACSLSYTIHQYVSHYHAERNHPGLDNRLIGPEQDMESDMGRSLFEYITGIKLFVDGGMAQI
jgi:hypothetical protein